MSESCTVLIAAPELLPALKAGSLGLDCELLAFPDSEALRALDAISRRRPQVVALERAFAASPRGAALINRIKADPALIGSEVRIVSKGSDDTRVVSPPTTRDSAASDAPATAAIDAPAMAEIDSPATATTPSGLDQRGTRRAPRFTMAPGVEVIVDGNVATVIDLSTAGAQIMSTTILKPKQRLRLTMADTETTLRLTAVVAWALFEIPPGSGPRYRAGVAFVNANATALDQFRLRHC